MKVLGRRRLIWDGEDVTSIVESVKFSTDESWLQFEIDGNTCDVSAEIIETNRSVVCNSKLEITGS